MDQEEQQPIEWKDPNDGQVQEEAQAVESLFQSRFPAAESPRLEPVDMDPLPDPPPEPQAAESVFPDRWSSSLSPPKERDTRIADTLRAIEQRAQPGQETTVFPGEYSNESPFEWQPFAGSPQQPEAQPRSEAEQNRLSQIAGNQAWNSSNPFDNNAYEELMRQMLEVLKSIDDKLPQQATYSE